jgi:iron complex outermembrane receptor protein
LKKIICGTVFFAAVHVAAQSRILTGRVKALDSREGLSSCTIVLRNGLPGIITDSTGAFVIPLPAGSVDPELFVSRLGYQTTLVRVASGNNHYEILLEPAAGTMEEVVVTGVTRATLIKNHPVPIALVQAKAIERSAETNIIDVLVKNVPGLNAVKTGPNISKPFIRGLGYNRVLTLYDGVRQEGQQWGDEHGIEVDGYNIEKAEVIKGPASLMYGSDALAGVVSLLPALPRNADGRLHGRVISEYQSNNGLAGNGFRLLHAGEQWSFALRGAYRMAKNYSNAIDGRVYNTGFKETNASVYAGYTGRKGNTGFNLSLYNNLQGIPDGSRDSLTRKFTAQAEEGTGDDVKVRPVVAPGLLASYSLSSLHQLIRHYRLYSNSCYTIGRGNFSFLLALQQNIRSEFNHPTKPEQAGMFVRLNTLNYSIGYSLPAFSNLRLSAGANGMYQSNKNKNATDFPIPDYYLFDKGAYLLAGWSRNKLTVNGGVRYDLRRIAGNDFYTKTDTVNGFARQVTGPDTAGAYRQFAAFGKTFTGLSFSIGAAWQINKKINVKANIARGYRAPNITEFAANGLDPGAHIVYLGNRDFIPELSLQEDIGVNIQLMDFSATIGLFNNHIRFYSYLSQLADAQDNPVIDAQGNKTLRYMQGRAQLFGMEASLAWRPQAIKGFGFDNRFSLIYGYNRNSSFKQKGVNGEYLPLIPPFRLLSGISRQVDLKKGPFASVELKAEGDFNAAQNRYLALNNTETLTPAYTLVNAGAFLDIRYAAKRNMLLSIQVNNLLNKVYQSNLSRLKYFEHYAQSPNGYSGIYGMGRNWCFKMLLSF